MSRASLRLLCVAAVAAGAAETTRARAQDDLADVETRNAARDLARRARQHFLAEEWEKARDLYHRAYELVHAPTLAVREARCLLELGRLVEAEEAYVEARRTVITSDSPQPFIDAVDEAKQQLRKLHERIPRVKIVLAGLDAHSEGLVVKLDGRVVPPALIGVERTIDPGDHVATLTTRGGPTSRESFSVAERETRLVELSTVARDGKPSARHASHRDGGEESTSGVDQRTWALVAGGVGLAGLGVGVAEGLIAVGKKSNLDEMCRRDRCPPSAKDDLDAFRSARTISTVGYVVGVLGIGGGVALYLTAGNDDAERSAFVPWVSVGAAGVRGAF